MSDFASRLKSLLFGSRDEQLSIPIMDGALKPNNALEEAPILCERRGLEDLAVAADGELYAACGPTIVRVGSDGVLTEVARFERDVTALAACPDGRLAAGLGDAIALDALRRDGPRIDTAAGQRLNAVNAIAAAPAGGLLIADGSTIRPYAQWCYDLLEKGRTGRIVACGADGRARNLAAGMEYAFGVLAEADGQALAAETWRHQLVRVGAGAKAPALANIAGYPARMTRAAGGGFWLTVFAARTQLVEFVLCENDYRRDMMRTVEPRFWVAPALSSGEDFREPLQGGSVKQMGILKPWAPPRSYGLVVRVGDDLIPKFSLHSRVGGRHHGVVAVAERGDELFVLSKGAGRILRLSVRQVSEGILG